MKKLIFLLLLTSCNQQHICYAKLEAETESKLARYRHDLIMNEINFREFEDLRDDALTIEKMKKIKCEGRL